MTEPASPDESSFRYPGWRIVFACFLVEFFIFGFGLYGLGVYLTEFTHLRGWPTWLVSGASTLSLLLSNLLVIYASDLLAWMGPRRLLLAGIACLAAALVLLAFTTTPWQLYAGYTLMAFGWIGMGTVVAATIISAWFQRRHGLAISLALNGATCGGIVITPILLALVARFGFTTALLVAAAAMVVILVPVVVVLIRLPSAARQIARHETKDQPAADPALASRWTLLRSPTFWMASAPFAIALLAQVGFIVHQIAILEPSLGRSLAGIAVSVTTAMAVIGRLCLGLLADRLDPRRATAGSGQPGGRPACDRPVERRFHPVRRLRAVWPFGRQPHHLAAADHPARISARRIRPRARPDDRGRRRISRLRAEPRRPRPRRKRQLFHVSPALCRAHAAGGCGRADASASGPSRSRRRLAATRPPP
jgi:MFS family permease